MSGASTLTLSGTNTYTGGTIVLNGTLVVTAPSGIEDGTDLFVGDPALKSLFPDAVIPAPVVPAAAAAVGIAPVPEPGTLLLVAAGAAVAWIYRKGRQAQKRSRR
jgi:autotransporter-associated beta strand protein